MRMLHSCSFKEKEGGKLNAFQTCVAVMKGYCALMILALPRAWVKGGYLLSPIILLISGVVQSYAAVKLVKAGQKLNLPSYSGITLKALGPTAKYMLDFMIASTQFSFSLSVMSYITSSW